MRHSFPTPCTLITAQGEPLEPVVGLQTAIQRATTLARATGQRIHVLVHGEIVWSVAAPPSGPLSDTREHPIDPDRETPL